MKNIILCALILLSYQIPAFGNDRIELIPQLFAGTKDSYWWKVLIQGKEGGAAAELFHQVELLEKLKNPSGCFAFLQSTVVRETSYRRPDGKDSTHALAYNSILAAKYDNHEYLIYFPVDPDSGEDLKRDPDESGKLEWSGFAADDIFALLRALDGRKEDPFQKTAKFLYRVGENYGCRRETRQKRFWKERNYRCWIGTFGPNASIAQ